ncbi:MAG: hypothetical protein L0Z50_15585 [Verrucomicrobiales bacterium]|nr:hypothetical protein [Verrucomicrobiales bacterium]
MLTASESAIITSFTISTVRKAFFTAVVWVVEGEAVGGHATTTTSAAYKLQKAWQRNRLVFTLQRAALKLG